MRRDVLSSISEKTARELCRRFYTLLGELGAGPRDTTRWYDVEIDTPAGLLCLKEPQPDTGWIFARFNDPDRAKRYVDCNPFSGKWNWHPSKAPAAEMFEPFETALRQLMTRETQP